MLPTTAFIETFKAMGAVPTPIPFNELYTAVQTGVVDGFEHDLATVLATKLFEVCKSCFLTEHLFSPMIVVIGKRGLDKIPADIRPAFLKAAAEATTYQRAQAVDEGRAAYAELKRLGVTFYPMAGVRARSSAQRNRDAGVDSIRGTVSIDQAPVPGDSCGESGEGRKRGWQRVSESGRVAYAARFARPRVAHRWLGSVLTW